MMGLMLIILIRWMTICMMFFEGFGEEENRVWDIGPLAYGSYFSLDRNLDDEPQMLQFASLVDYQTRH